MFRQAARTKGRQKAVSKTVSLPAPVGGWNARDSLAAMPIGDAVILQNMFPATTECVLRKGYSVWADGLPGPVETLMTYEGGDTESELWAISGNAIYDCTAGGAVGAAAVSSLTNSRWQFANVATAGGNFLYAANGYDAPLLYNGSTWTAITGVSTPAITGVTTTDLNTPIVFKSRVWFIQRGTLKTWYLPAISVGGAAQAVDMSAVAQLGGYIVCHGTWTIDAGQGVDDYYVAVTNKGEVIVYQGTDPSDATAWALKGVWRVGSPVGQRCLFKYAGDLLMVCQDGVLPLASALQSSRVNPKVALTNKIQSAISTAVTAYGGNFGWELTYFARENQLWLNVPVAEGSRQQQYVMNSITGAWCNYDGWDANCWASWGDAPYFGGDTFVAKAWDTNADGTSGITAVGLQAFYDYGAPGLQKRFTLMRPILRANGAPSILGSINTDFQTAVSTAPLSFTSISYGLWGSAVWGTSVWGSGLAILKDWQGEGGIGEYGAPQLKMTSSNLDVRWVSTAIVYEYGTIL